MTTAAIVKIPVDSSEFEKFAEAFQEWQVNLKTVPDQWKVVDKAVKETEKTHVKLGGTANKTLSGILKATAELEKAVRAATAAVNEFAGKTATAGMAAEKAWKTTNSGAVTYVKVVKEAEKAQKHLAEGGKGAESAMKKMAMQGKSLAASMFSAVRFAAKFSTFGIGGGLIGAGAGLFGLDALAHGVLSTQRTAQGLGLTAGQYNSFRLNMQRYAGTNVLSGAAEAQIDQRKWGFLAALGISPAQAASEPATALAQQEIMAVHRAWKQNPTLLSAQAQSALQLGFTSEDIRRIGTAHGANLRAAGFAVGQDAGALGFSRQVAQEWSAFSIQMQKAGKLIETALINTLTPLTPQLTRLSKEIADMITGLSQSGEVKKWVSGFATGIKALAEWLGSPAFKADLHAAGAAVKVFSQSAASAAEFLYNLTGQKKRAETVAAMAAAGFVSAGPVGAVVGGVAGSAYHKPVSFMTPALASAREKFAWDYYRKQGYTAEQTAGILANAQRESSFDITAQNGTSYGLFQWTAARQQQFKKLYGHSIKNSTLLEQLQFSQWELTHSEKAAGDVLRAKKSAGGSARAFSTYYERPLHPNSEAEKRAAIAVQIAADMAPQRSVSQPAVAAAPGTDDLATVLRRLRRQQSQAPATVTIQNNTSAMVHVSANAAAP